METPVELNNGCNTLVFFCTSHEKMIIGYTFSIKNVPSQLLEIGRIKKAKLVKSTKSNKLLIVRIEIKTSKKLFFKKNCHLVK